MSFTIGQRLKVANPSYSNDDLAGPYASIAQCEADFPTALLHEGRKVGIVQGDGRIKEYEWNLISQDPDEWELNPVQADADVDLTTTQNHKPTTLLAKNTLKLKKINLQQLKIQNIKVDFQI